MSVAVSVRMSTVNFCAAELIQRTDLSERLAVFQFRVTEPLTFRPGQYATLGVTKNGDLIERPYSIVSSPYEKIVEFFIELVPEGTFTPEIWKLKSGATITIRRRVAGRLTLASSMNRHLMIATVTGVAPFVSILRTKRSEQEREINNNNKFLLIHSASSTSDFGPYLGELRQLERFGWLKYVPTISRPWTEANWDGEVGRAEDVLRKYCDLFGFNHSNSSAYLCGHPKMVENVTGILTRARFSTEQIEREDYFVPHHAEREPLIMAQVN